MVPNGSGKTSRSSSVQANTPLYAETSHLCAPIADGNRCIAHQRGRCNLHRRTGIHIEQPPASPVRYVFPVVASYIRLTLSRALKPV